MQQLLRLNEGQGADSLVFFTYINENLETGVRQHTLLNVTQEVVIINKDPNLKAQLGRTGTPEVYT